MYTISRVFHIILDTLFPRSETVQALESMTPDVFIHTAQPAENLSHITAYFAYRDTFVKEAIWQLKYRRNTKVARTLATVLSDYLLEDLHHKEQFEYFINPILIPIPLSKRKKYTRGYNQTELVASMLSSEFLTVDTTILKRSHDATSQTKTRDRAERIKNTKGCFAIEDTEKVKNKNIIVFDDVVTTGSTLREAERVLLQAGAQNVWLVAIAH